jgi:parvulin-like peptidyl-prolyl isomerase
MIWTSTTKTALPVALALLTVSSAVMAQTRTPAPARAAAPAPAAPAKPAAPVAPAAVGEAVKGDEVIARIAGSEVTAEEVRATIALLDQRQQAAAIRDPAVLSQTVRAILANRLVLKEALAKKWDQQPAVVAQLARARENVILEGYLQSVTAPPDSYPNETEIKSVYEANLNAFLVPRRFQLAQILVAVAKDADKAAEDTARKKLDDVLKKAKQPGADFAALARTLSDDQATAERDGQIGWVGEPDLKPEIRSQVIGLEKQGITDPIKLDDGWHVIKLLDTEASHTRPLAEVRDALVQRMRAERAEANRRAYVGDLVKQSPPEVNEIALSRLFGSKGDVPAH